MRERARSFGAKIMAAALAIAGLSAGAAASEFSEPWRRADRALVVDAYEYNEIDWQKLATDKRIAGFIGKGSDGLPPNYRCSGDEAEKALCSALWKRYSVAKELFHTRKTVAKALGMEWGAYHLGRPGNPIEQANHFLDFAQPGPDDLVALDIEENDPERWMSLEDAEEFARHIKRRIGRFPVLYTNGNTAKYIADNRETYPLLSRLPLWYARYKPEIGEHFPKGNWESYALWQFVSQTNCNARKCPYRVPGTNHDIDVNVSSMDVESLREAWPFDALVDVPVEMIASIPVPTPRHLALGGGDVTLTFASVSMPKSVAAFSKVFAGAGAHQDKLSDDRVKPARAGIKLAGGLVRPAATYVRLSVLKARSAKTSSKLPYSDRHVGTAEYFAWRKDNGLPVELALGDSGKDSRLVAHDMGDIRDRVRVVTTAVGRDVAKADSPTIPDSTTTGSVAITIAVHSARDKFRPTPDSQGEGKESWFDRIKPYLGLFD